jgi:hypothetical protein
LSRHGTLFLVLGTLVVAKGSPPRACHGNAADRHGLKSLPPILRQAAGRRA